MGTLNIQDTDTFTLLTQHHLGVEAVLFLIFVILPNSAKMFKTNLLKLFCMDLLIQLALIK